MEDLFMSRIHFSAFFWNFRVEVDIKKDSQKIVPHCRVIKIEKKLFEVYFHPKFIHLCNNCKINIHSFGHIFMFTYLFIW